MWAQPLWGGESYENIVFDGTSNRIISGTVNNPHQCCGDINRTWGFQGATKRDTNTYQFAVGGRYDMGPLRVTGDAHQQAGGQLIGRVGRPLLPGLDQ